MQLKVKLVEVLPLQTGMGKVGEWKKQSIVVETIENYPKKICVNIWGDKINEKILNLGATLDISFDIESREFSGKWYTDVKAWKVELATETANSAPDNSYQRQSESLPDVPPPHYLDSSPTDDLPF
jgi:hypothetical protein